MKKLRWAIAACLGVMLCAPVTALADKGSKVERQTVRVSYGDLDIERPEGAKRLYARLKRASRTACGVDSYIVLGSIERVVESKQCYRDMLDRFVERIDSDTLDRLHNS